MSFGTIGSGHSTISMSATLMPPVRHTSLKSLMPERLNRLEEEGYGIINNTNGRIASLCLGQTKTACYPQLVETSFYLCPNPTQTCLCDA